VPAALQLTELRHNDGPMILILQIAAGIVLGFLILQNLPRILQMLNRIWRIALTFGVLAALIILGLVLESGIKRHGKDVAVILGALAMMVLVGVAVQYTARGLGYLYVSQRASVAASRRWTNLFRMIGVHPSWHTTNLPKAEIVTKVGDAIFTGLWKILIFYFFATIAVLLVVIQIVGAIPLDKQKPLELAAVWIVSALVPGVLVFLWISRRRRAGPSDRDTTPPEDAQ
jgi:hypothetical protein